MGNPPFLGASRMREALGDGYTERLRAAYPEVPESADLVMYWWERAAREVREGRARRFGLITTNSLPQTFNRRVVERHLAGEGAGPDAPGPLALTFAVPDHPWVDGADGAAVRVAMTAAARAADADPEAGRLTEVTAEADTGDGFRDVETAERVGEINADLTVGPDVTEAEPLAANAGISSPGVKLHGAGFIVSPEAAKALGLGRVRGLDRHIRPYRNGRDLTQAPRGVMVIDLFGLKDGEVRDRFPEVYEHVLREVKPDRDTNRRKGYRENWWIHGEARTNLRAALDGLPRYIATVETSKHRFFQFLDASILPDNMLVAIALDDAYHLGVLSSAAHVEWALRAGGTLEDRPRYNKTKCFEPFPFPAPSPHDAEVRAAAEALDRHRAERQRLTGVGLTDLYNAVEALRAGRDLTAREARAAEDGLAHTLLDLHRRVDRAVLAAYGWADLDAEAPTFRAAVLERLVDLGRERRAEEHAGRVRYLRPAFQAPEAEGQAGLALGAAPRPRRERARRAWPASAREQLVAVRRAVEAGAETPEAVRARFTGAASGAVAEALETLADLGTVRRTPAGFAV